MENTNYTYRSPAEEPAREKRFQPDKRDYVCASLIAVLAVAISFWGIFSGYMLGWTVLFCALLAVSSVYLRGNARYNTFAVICLVTAVAVSCIFTVTTNGTVRFFGFILSILLALAWFGYTATPAATGDLELFAVVFSPLLRLTFPFIPVAARSLLAGKDNRNRLGKVAIGIAAALPVLLVVVPLLISSDVAFEGLVNNIGSNLLSAIWKIAVGLGIAAVCIGYCFALRKEPLTRRPASAFKGMDTTVVVSFLSAIAVCYLAYLFSQTAYFFSAFSGFLPKDYTFTVSAYARRGFFEMAIIAAINVLLIFCCLLVSRKQNDKPPIITRSICAFIAVFTLIIITTAISKMVLYVQDFGLTVLRIGTTVFMLLLAAIFAAILLRLFLPCVRVLRVALISAAICIVFLGCGNVNRMAASYNYHAYKSNALASIDLHTLYELGSEGVPYLLELTQDENVSIARDAHDYLQRHLSDDTFYTVETVKKDGKTYTVSKRRYSSIAHFNLARNRAYALLDEYMQQQ